MYNNYNKEINTDPIDLLRSSKNEKESKTNNEEKLFKEDDDEQNEYQLNWMLLSEIGPKPYFDCSSDLGFRDIDQNHDWINDPRK